MVVYTDPLCSSRKNPNPPHGRSSEIPGWGQIMKLHWNFLGGGGDAKQKPSMEGVWMFSGTTHYDKE